MNRNKQENSIGRNVGAEMRELAKLEKKYNEEMKETELGLKMLAIDGRIFDMILKTKSHNPGEPYLTSMSINEETLAQYIKYSRVKLQKNRKVKIDNGKGRADTYIPTENRYEGLYLRRTDYANEKPPTFSFVHPNTTWIKNNLR